jgi:cation:H+ antiporter
VQFAIPGTDGRLLLSGVYLVIAAVLTIRHRHQLWPTLSAPFRRRPAPRPELRPSPTEVPADDFRSKTHA